jgi:nuclear pore complex protein Nup210
LEGVEFNWSIGTQSRNTKNDGGNVEYQVLKFLTFSESKYHQVSKFFFLLHKSHSNNAPFFKVPREVERFDTMGLKGHMTLIEGINSGSAKVIVKLPYEEYQRVPQVEVDITVLANLIIDPTDVHILVGDSINFKVLQLKQGKLHEVTLGPQYYLEIEKKEYAKIDKSLALGLKLGTTEVLLRDKNVIENSLNPPLMPKARLTVSEASKININLLPHYNWNTVTNENHEIAIDLYTQSEERITLGQKYKIESTFDQKLFKESNRCINGSRIAGGTIERGISLVTGTFNKLVANAEMIIHDKIDLNPRLVVLPYDHLNKQVNQKIQFHASGGDGLFTWFSGNQKILTVGQDGLAETRTEKIKDFNVESSDGSLETTVRAAMSKNLKIFKTAKVIFLPPVKLEIIAYNFEAAINDFIDVHIGLFAYYDNKYLPFTSCENIVFDTDFSTQIFSIVNVDLNEAINKAKNACRIVRLKGTHAGLSSMSVSYRHGNELLTDSVQLMVYEKLINFNPVSNLVVLPIGSSRNVIYQYGPKKIYTVSSELMKNLDYGKNIIDVTEIKADFQDQRFGYSVLCRKVGETKLKIEVFNMLNQKNFLKSAAIIETVVHCVKPRFINLYSLDKLKTSCPIDGKSSLLHVRSMQDALDIEIEVLDHQMRKLENITSLVIDWKFLQASGSINHNIAYNRETEVDDIDGVYVPKRDFLRTSITEINVNHKIKAIVTQYDETVLRKNDVNAEIPNFGIQKIGDSRQLITPLIENELDYLSFDSSLLPFSSVSIFFSSNSQRRIKLGRGSAFYDIKIKHPSLLDVQFDKTSSELVLKPKQIGETIVEISDRCLKIEPSRLHVSIVGIGRVEFSCSDRVEKSKIIEGIAKLYDTNDHLMDIDFNNLKIYTLNEKVFNEHIISVKRDANQENLKIGEIRYVITGNELGETKIIVTSGTVSSSPASVQVFPPLQLLPRNATIIVGSHLEISSKGGPDTNVVYSISTGEILAIDGSVVEGLKVGKTKVTGKSIGINPMTGSAVSFSEDTVYVNVVPLNKIKIRTPLQRIKAGATMPVTLWADNDISPMILGTLKNLKIKWQTDASDVIELRDVFEEIGVVYSESDAISMHVRGVKQGKARITATVYHVNSKFQASVEVSVFKSLELESPKKILYDPIIIPPKMTIHLKTNLDDTTFSINDQSDRSVINVSKDGTVKSQDLLGMSLIVASSASNDQQLDIPVEVKNINYIMASVVPNIQTKGNEHQLPKDLNFAIHISLHDNLGNVFSHSFEEIKWHSSNRDSAEIVARDNLTINVKLIRQGTNMLAISLRDYSSGIKYSEDYIKLSVKSGNGIFNEKLVATIGDIICFDSPLNTLYKWETNSEALLLYGSTGRITTIPPNQKVGVYHGIQGSAFINYEVQVRNPDNIKFVNRSNKFNGETFNAHFIISHYQQGDKMSSIIANNLTSCEDLQNVSNYSVDFVECKFLSDDYAILKKFEIGAVFDITANTYACQIKPLTTLEDITTYTRGKDINIQLEVKLLTSGITDRIALTLIPAVQISPKVMFIDKLDQNEIVISGIESILQNVIVTSSHPENLIIVPSIPKTVGRLQFKPKLYNTAAIQSELFIKISSPQTHQTVKIPILPPNQAEFEKNEENWIKAFVSNTGKVIALTVIVITTMGFFFMCLRNRDLDTSGSELISSCI